jgi:hypothetical protein
MRKYALVALTLFLGTGHAMAYDDAAKAVAIKNINWVFTDDDAKDDFLKAYDQPSGTLEWLFGDRDKYNGYQNGYSAILYAQRHNQGSYDSIVACGDETVAHLGTLGYKAQVD